MSALNERIGQPLDNLLARELTLQWAEAVALIQGTCRQLIATGAAGFPEASRIVLYAEGTVVALTTAKQEPVPAAAHLLASMLRDDVPLRLRLLVSQATTTASGYATLKDFSDALAYFERPDSQSILSGLYQRAVSAPPRQDVDTGPPGLTSSAALPAPRPAAVRARTSRWAIGAAVAAGLLCLAVLFLGGRAGGATAHMVTAPGDPRTTTTPSADKPAAGSAQPHAAKPAAVLPKLSRAPVEAPNSTPPLDALPILHSQTRNIASLVPSIGPFPQPPVAVPLAQGSHLQELSRTIGPVYSTADADVVPPQSVYAKMPPDRPNARHADRTVVDLLISADGLVEHVRLRTRPRDVHEFMLVSVAKAWRFDPATVHGRPVRFLHSIPITSDDSKE